MRQPRFDWAVSGSPMGHHPLADRDLCAFPECVVSPSLGAIVPGWLLIIPKKPVLALRDLPAEERCIILQRARSIAAEVGGPGGHVAVFEHGPGQRASAAGCGIDQAHLHVVPLAFDLIERVRSRHPEHSWRVAPVNDPWQQLVTDVDYYLVGGAGGTYVSEPIEVVSQFFRRIIAEAVGKADEWDYRRHPHDGNILATIDLYGPALRRAA